MSLRFSRRKSKSLAMKEALLSGQSNDSATRPSFQNALQRSIPFADRVQGFWQAQLKSGTWSLSLAATSAVLAVIVTFGYFLFSCLIIFIAGEPADIKAILPDIPANAAASAAFGFLMLPLASRIYRALYGSQSERSVLTAVAYCLVSLPIFPMLLILIHGGLGLQGWRIKSWT